MTAKIMRASSPSWDASTTDFSQSGGIPGNTEPGIAFSYEGR
jgi:hypothetical protein